MSAFKYTLGGIEVEVSGYSIADVDTRDYPDFVDAFIEEAYVDGEPATEIQLDALNEDSQLIHELVMERLF